METTLVDRTYSYIRRIGQPVSLTHLKDKTKDICTPLELLDALGQVAKLKDIKVTVKDDTNWYSIRQPTVSRTPTARYQPSKEERDVMDKELDDFFMHSPLVSDSERACYIASKTDRNRWKTCECEGCVHWRWMRATREERAVHEINRVREVMKSI